jgi:phosphopantetheinyl transferase (holo-ACP synthase)
MGRYGLSSQEVSAVVWSVKEAVVKALGCGFRLIDPLDVAVEWVGTGTAGDWSIRLLNTARKRLATRNDFRVQARTFRHSTQFVSVAVTAQ